jgi:hypothetical protein
MCHVASFRQFSGSDRFFYFASFRKGFGESFSEGFGEDLGSVHGTVGARVLT